MFAVYAQSSNFDDPLAGLGIGERPDPEVSRDSDSADDPRKIPRDWAVVRVKAASINHHDVWSLKGVGLPEERLPMILGCDAAGLDEDGNQVIVHAVINDPAWTGNELHDPKRSLLSERFQGTFAEKVAVPRQNLLPKPASLSFEEAACLPTAWLTAYRMLFSKSGLQPGDSVLIQGAGGGVATALIALARAAGFRVFATSRDEEKRARALELGAHEAIESGGRLPQLVDAVMETVGAATWSHSVKSLKPGGTIVISGTTSGPNPPNAELMRLFFQEKNVVGSTMGSRAELGKLIEFLDVTGVRPLIDQVAPMDQAAAGLERVASGDVFGKIVLTL